MADDSIQERVTQLFRAVPDAVDVVALSPGETLRYFTGVNMHKSERPTLVFLFREGSPVVVHPELEGDVSRRRFQTQSDTRTRTLCTATTSPTALATGSASKATNHRISSRGMSGHLNPDTLSVEPGIYVPELGGVRIEDDVVVTADGANVPTTSSRDLRVLQGR